MFATFHIIHTFLFLYQKNRFQLWTSMLLHLGCMTCLLWRGSMFFGNLFWHIVAGLSNTPLFVSMPLNICEVNYVSWGIHWASLPKQILRMLHLHFWHFVAGWKPSSTSSRRSHARCRTTHGLSNSPLFITFDNNDNDDNVHFFQYLFAIPKINVLDMLTSFKNNHAAACLFMWRYFWNLVAGIVSL